MRRFLWKVLKSEGGFAGPLGLFATWAHESSHAIVGWIDGASISRVDIAANGSGATGVATSGAPSDFTEVTVGSAGYLGTVIVGAILLAAGRSQRAAKITLIVVGLCMIASALIWMPSAFAFGVSFGLGALIIALTFILPGKWAQLLATGLGALTIFEGLIRITDVGDGTTDAVLTHHFSGLSVGTIRILWLIVGVVVAIGAVVVRTGPLRKKVNQWDAETGGGKDELPDPSL